MRMRLVSITIALAALAAEANASAWLLQPGQTWVKATWLHQTTSWQFASPGLFCGNGACRSGERVRYFFGGRSTASGVFVEARYGLLRHWEVGVKVPYYRLAYHDEANPNREPTTSWGDLQVELRRSVVDRGGFAAAIKLAAKAPTGFYNKDSEVVPVGDGQWDAEMYLQLGRSLWPLNGYLSLEAGYRWRFENEEVGLKPGNETVVVGEGGYFIWPWLMGKMRAEAILGVPFEQRTGIGLFELRHSERRIVQLSPVLVFFAKSGLVIEAGVQIPLTGQNYPAGATTMLGLAYSR